MKKSFFPGACALLLCALTACGPDQGRPISHMNNLSATDSLIYYYGQIRAHDYDRQAIADTNLRHLDQREAYLQGIRDGFNLIRSDDEAYNLGARVGVRMAVAQQRFEAQYDCKLDKKVLFESISYGIYNSDSIRGKESIDQKQMYALLRQLSVKQRNSDIRAANETVTEAAKKLKMRRIAPFLYSRLIKKTDGEPVHKGMTIVADVDYRRLNGDDLGMPNPEELVVGSESMPEVMTRAYSSLRSGESAEFVTSAYELFGSRCSIIDLKPEDVVMIRITIRDCIDQVHNPDSTL